MDYIKNTFLCVWHNFFPEREYKRRKIDHGISGTEIRNYMLKDPIIDWLNKYGEYFGYVKENSNDNYISHLLNRGNEFEKLVIENYDWKHYRFVDIKEKYPLFCEEGFQETIQHIKKGTEIIYQGFLKNDTFYGIPDLMIRTDIFHNLFSCFPEIEHPAKSKKHTYYVIDIKLSSIHLGKGNQILNKDHVRAYKGQIYIYNKILEDITGVFQRYGFLLGRRIVMHDSQVKNGRELLAVVDFEKEDISKDVFDAVVWLNDLKENGISWDVEVPHRSELKPNMKNANDYPWSSAKRMIAALQDELTRCWKISHKMRNSIQNEFNNDIQEYLDGHGMRDSQKSIISKMNSNYISLNLTEEKIGRLENLFNSFNFYVDFEFISGSELHFDYQFRRHLYMIGVGFQNQFGKWEYHVFIPERLTDVEEKYNIYKWIQFIDVKSREFGFEKYQLIHWSNAEPGLFNSLKESWNIRKNLNWVDLLDIVKDIEFVCPGMKNFGLKSVAKSLNRCGLIETTWEDSVADGLGANLIIINGIDKNLSMKNISDLPLVIKYNEIDCKVMYEITKYLSRYIYKKSYLF